MKVPVHGGEYLRRRAYRLDVHANATGRRCRLSRIALVASALIVSLLTAAPAHASTTVIASSASGFTITPSTITGTTFTLDVQTDTLTSVSVWGVASGSVANPPFGGCDADGDCQIPTGQQATFTVAASSAVQLVNIKYSAGGAVRQLAVLPPLSPDDTSQEPLGPGPLIQQISRLHYDDCTSVDLPELDWSGVESGGWTPSWAWWVNDGQGGPVCTRTLVYRQSDSSWAVET